MLTPTCSLTGTVTVVTVTIVTVTITTLYYRIEDLTNQDVIRHNPQCDRTITLYGYVRGAPIKNNSMVHIAGKVVTLNNMIPMASQAVEISHYRRYHVWTILVLYQARQRRDH